MMNDWLDRTRRLLGEEALTALAGARVAVLGLGGVGSAAAEGVCRGGVGALLLADCDTVDPTNRNRQLIALRSTEGRPKTSVAAARLADIAPEARLTQLQERLIPENLPLVFDWQPDLVLDAIDTVTTKLALAASCRERGIPLLTCLGTGNRLDPSQLRLGTIEDTAGCGCPLARVLRRELKRRGLSGQPVLYSLEPPLEPAEPHAGENGRHPPASSAFVPPAAGFLMASWAVRTLLHR